MELAHNGNSAFVVGEKVQQIMPVGLGSRTLDDLYVREIHLRHLRLSLTPTGELLKSNYPFDSVRKLTLAA